MQDKCFSPQNIFPAILFISGGASRHNHISARIGPSHSRASRSIFRSSTFLIAAGARFLYSVRRSPRLLSFLEVTGVNAMSKMRWHDVKKMDRLARLWIVVALLEVP